MASFQPTHLVALDRVVVENSHLPACDAKSSPATCRRYDGFDRVLSETLPDKRTISYAYQNVSASGTVYAQTTTTNPRKLKSERRFDANGSLISVKRFNADNTTVAASYSYQSDGAGRMVSVADPLGERRVTFDEGGRLTHATLPRAASAQPALTRVHSYCYNTKSQIISAETPAGRTVAMDRDLLGRTSRVSVDFEHRRNDQNITEATTADFYYDCSKAEGSLGRLCRQSDSAATTRIEYDLYGRPNRYEVELSPAIAATLPASVSNWYHIQLTYGTAGQLEESVVEGLNAGPHRVSVPTRLSALAAIGPCSGRRQRLTREAAARRQGGL